MRNDERERWTQCLDAEKKKWNTARRDRMNEHHCEQNEFFRKFMDYIHKNYRAKIYNGRHGREWVREMTWLSTDPLHPPPPGLDLMIPEEGEESGEGGRGMKMAMRTLKSYVCAVIVSEEKSSCPVQWKALRVTYCSWWCQDTWTRAHTDTHRHNNKLTNTCMSTH